MVTVFVNREKDTETMEFDLEAILKIMDRFDKSNMSKFMYETEEYTFQLEAEKAPIVAAQPVVVSGNAPVQPVAETVVTTDTAEKAEGTVITSPLVGTFYAAKAEGEAPFISVGDTVKKGQVIGIVEAMKLMNEIEAESDGTVAEILVENEQLVEFGQPLVRLV